MNMHLTELLGSSSVQVSGWNERPKCVQVRDAAAQIWAVNVPDVPKGCTLPCWGSWPPTTPTCASWMTGSVRSRSPALTPCSGGCSSPTWPRTTLPNSSKKVNNFIPSKFFPNGLEYSGFGRVLILHWYNRNASMLQMLVVQFYQGPVVFVVQPFPCCLEITPSWCRSWNIWPFSQLENWSPMQKCWPRTWISCWKLGSHGGFCRLSINSGWFWTLSCPEGIKAQNTVWLLGAHRWEATFSFKNNDTVPLSGRLEAVTE